MRVSILTPCFNAAPFLETVWQCLVDERLPELEWVVVDDGSTDNSLGILRCLALRPELRLVVIGQSNMGACHARNIALNHCSGDWVKFLDADDYFEAGHLRDLVSIARESESDAYIAPTQQHVYSSDGKLLCRKRLSRWCNIPDDLLDKAISTTLFHHSAGLYRKSVVIEIEGWDTSLEADQDGDFYLRLMLAGARFQPCEHAAPFYYRIHSITNRISSMDTHAKIASRLKVCYKLKDHFSERKLLDRYAVSLSKRMFRVAQRAVLVDEDLGNMIQKEARELSPLCFDVGSWKFRILFGLLGLRKSVKLFHFLQKLTTPHDAR